MRQRKIIVAERARKKNGKYATRFYIQEQIDDLNRKYPRKQRL